LSVLLCFCFGCAPPGGGGGRRWGGGGPAPGGGAGPASVFVLGCTSRATIARVSATRRSPDLVVVSALRDWSCASCGSDEGDLLVMDDRGPICMACADLAHLVFLPRGDTALTRRARKHSRLSAVVVRFSRARGRYERQGVLVEPGALAQAETECLGDAEVRARRREREAERRVGEDAELVRVFASAISELFPGCPVGRCEAIAAHAGERSSGRVGRTAGARALDPEMITLAVVASVRHEDTAYDDLLMAGVERAEARRRVWGDVEGVLEGWRGTTRQT
jgi:hypothetical protein